MVKYLLKVRRPNWLPGYSYFCEGKGLCARYVATRYDTLEEARNALYRLQDIDLYRFASPEIEEEYDGK